MGRKHTSQLQSLSEGQGFPFNASPLSSLLLMHDKNTFIWIFKNSEGAKGVEGMEKAIKLESFNNSWTTVIKSLCSV